MDDPRVLRIITIGLVLAALAVVYFLLTGGFAVSKPKVNQTKVDRAVGSPSPTAIPLATTIPSATPTTAYESIVNRTQDGTQALPRTGFSAGLLLVFSISAMISGLSLRKYPY